MSELIALVVEDDEGLAVITSATLQSAGFSVETARDGETALAWLESSVPTLIVLDLNLPGISGPEVLTQVRADDRMKETRIIAVTGYPVMSEGLGDQVDLVLIKPFGVGQLREFALRLAASETE